MAAAELAPVLSFSCLFGQDEVFAVSDAAAAAAATILRAGGILMLLCENARTLHGHGREFSVRFRNSRSYRGLLRARRECRNPGISSPLAANAGCERAGDGEALVVGSLEFQRCVGDAISRDERRRT